MIRTDVEINEAPFESYWAMRHRTRVERTERRAHRQVSPADWREPLERPHKPRCCKPMYGGLERSPVYGGWATGTALYG